MIYSDIENEENREKVLVTETNLLLMDKIIESIDWIFEKLSGVWSINMWYKWNK